MALFNKTKKFPRFPKSRNIPELPRYESQTDEFDEMEFAPPSEHDREEHRAERSKEYFPAIPRFKEPLPRLELPPKLDLPIRKPHKLELRTKESPSGVPKLPNIFQKKEPIEYPHFEQEREPMEYPREPVEYPHFEQERESREYSEPEPIRRPLAVEPEQYRRPTQVVSSGPIFVKLEEYRQAIKNLDIIKNKIDEASSILSELLDLKKEEDHQLSEWHKELTEIKDKILDVDSELFEVSK